MVRLSLTQGVVGIASATAPASASAVSRSSSRGSTRSMRTSVSAGMRRILSPRPGAIHVHFPEGGSRGPPDLPILDGSAAGDSDQGATRGRPFGLYVHGRYDTAGAVRSVTSIVGALPWRQAAPVLEVLGDPDDDRLAAAYELGGTLAALVAEA